MVLGGGDFIDPHRTNVLCEVCVGFKFSIVLASINVYNIGAVLELIEVLP